MKIFQALKQMVSNKTEVQKDRDRMLITYECIYTNDRMVYFNRSGGSFIIVFEFEHEIFFELIQMLENFPSGKWKLFSFSKKSIILANLSVDDLIRIVTRCRFSNNIFIDRLLQIIHSYVPEVCIKGIPELDTGAYLKTGIVGDEIDVIYDITEEDVKEKVLLSLDGVSVIAYDDIKNTTERIVYAIPELAPYITDWDILDLCNILIDDNCTESQFTFKEFIKRYKMCSIVSLLVSKNLLTKEQVSIDRPLKFTDDMDESVDEDISEVEVVDSSNIPESNFITDNNIKGE